MLIRIKGGRVVDPTAGRDAVGDVDIENGRVVAASERTPDRTIDASGCVVMAGGVEVHSHIAGGNVVLSRLLLPDLYVSEAAPEGHPFAHAGGSAAWIGANYARMGYTTAVEPAMPPSNALATQLELADIPLLDRGALAVMGNDDHLLSLLREGEGRNAVRDLVALNVATSRGLGVKCINAGGASAFKDGMLRLSLDDEIPVYGLSTRRIMGALLDAVEEIGVPHPLHVHCNNLGLPGADESFVATLDAAEGRRIHFAHAQFYAYGVADPENPATGGFRSAAERIIRAMETNPNATFDVGQVVFGQTVTISLDILRQFAGRKGAKPKKWILNAGDAEGGGVVPFLYRPKGPTSSLQWAIGLELMLLSGDPERTILTTDHPNGGPFTEYPRIIHWLMDKEERDREIATLPKIVGERSSLPGLEREYTLSEIAKLTRSGPAKLLGLDDRGHLRPGARADVAVYRDSKDRTAMFSRARLVLKDGQTIVEDGEVVDWRAGHSLSLSVESDKAMARRSDAYLKDRFGAGLDSFAVPDEAFPMGDVFEDVACRA
ncbi:MULTISPECIES: formylmethanofuran dehydrogenase subunit A [Methylobacterium]|uniref:Formyltransferase/hydrolase complex Fhc subunit A n=10 Tax=Pseudomonadota TaxID=1224 RepID=A0ABQ4SSZ7_9HYPH|nr:MULTISPECIES: formylmethanofuran dehydrogenase subunit A [Methylobacterium]PIU07824.1 MAG: formylmethanofuran dehydrogenase subunit A [Methylobacterium sp. CG09_land_8_20_14_0_10_71_15]PIU13125.1 MAG: formylmethanofuran dehydrogenase subunit A [Methylobacterium sp. CG08_land_8_20_14_0_20_71_15]GBU15983.1 formylmethanofuran dehydrogenase subunit A [Methylobacterium sp.]GJE05614.1 Formyltransferase/hydrolase complex Fhc subunit A [Methylobacterium jeotgali]